MDVSIRRELSGRSSVVAQVRSSPAFRSATQAIAESLGTSSSALYRQALIYFAQHHPSVDDELARELAEAGSKIRQLATAGCIVGPKPSTTGNSEG